MKEYKNIRAFYNSDDVRYEYAEVTYKDGTKEKIIGDAEVKNALINFALQYGSINELLDDKECFEKVEISHEKKDEKEHKEESKEEKVEEDVLEEEERHRRSDKYNKKSKNGKVTLRYVSTAVLTVLGVGAIGGTIWYFLNRDKSKEQTRYEDYRIISHAEAPTESDYNQIFNHNAKSAMDETQNGKLISAIYHLKKGSCSEEEFLFILNTIKRLSNANMAEVRKLVDGGRMSGDEYRLSFGSFFEQTSYDYVAVSSFCNLRNNIVENAYKNDRRETSEALDKYLDKVLGFILGGKTMNFNDSKLGYYSLSPLAQYTVLQLAMGPLSADAGYSFVLNGKTVKYDKLSEKLSNLESTNINDFSGITRGK